jgi:predicted nuclease of predicted toxin-antitoxin system
MKFLIDNALSPTVSQCLCDAGHDSIHVRDIGLADAADAVVFAVAKEQDRILVSADTDFGMLLAQREESKPSVILFRGDITRDPHKQVAVLADNLAAITDELTTGSIVVFDGRRIRIRKLPL